ncbi:hypothetical protein [uncultured Amnibacterium sp.]
MTVSAAAGQPPSPRRANAARSAFGLVASGAIRAAAESITGPLG